MSNKPVTISYAQNREDLILQGFFKSRSKPGFYVDIGSFDPDEDSVTKLFYLNGWTGINVEPQQNRFKLFEKKRPRDINVNLGISNKNTKLELRSFKNQGLSTFSGKMKKEHKENSNEHTSEYEDIKIDVITLEKLFETHKIKEINFLKIDVEGFEYEVLEGNNWQKYRPEIICIEANHINRDWRPMLLKNEYELVFYDGLNEYYRDKKSNSDLNFNYVDSIVFKEPIVNYKFEGLINSYEQSISVLESEKRTQIERTEHYKTESKRLSDSIKEITPLRKHIKRQVKMFLLQIDRSLLRFLGAINTQPQQLDIVNLKSENEIKRFLINDYFSNQQSILQTFLTTLYLIFKRSTLFLIRFPSKLTK